MSDWIWWKETQLFKELQKQNCTMIEYTEGIR